MKRPALAIRRFHRSLVFAAATVSIFVLPAGLAFARGGHGGGGGHAGGAHFGVGHVGAGGGHVGNAGVPHYGGAHFDGHAGSHIGGNHFGSGRVATGHFGDGGIAAHHNSSSRALSRSTGASRGSHFTARGAQHGSSLALNHHSGANRAGTAHLLNHGHHDGFHHHHHFFFFPFAFGYPFFYGNGYGYGYPYSYPYNYAPDPCDPNSPYYDPDYCDSLYSQDNYQGYSPGKNPVPATQPTRQNQYPLNQNQEVDPGKNSSSAAGTTQLALQTVLTNSASTEEEDAEPYDGPAAGGGSIYVPLLPATSAPEVLPAGAK